MHDFESPPPFLFSGAVSHSNSTCLRSKSQGISMSIRILRRYIVPFYPVERGKRLSLINATLLLVILSSVLPARLAMAQTTTPVYTFPECESVEEELLLSELNRISHAALEVEQGGLDVDKLVEENWLELGLDRVVDKAVDDAIEQVRREEGTLDRVFSGWSEDKAREFAEKVASYAFGSREFRGAVDELASEIVEDLTDEIHLMTVRTASSSLLCVQEFIGTTFSEVMSHVLEEDIRNWLKEVAETQDEEVQDFDVLSERALSIAGIGAIVGAKIAHSLARKVARGILGKVVTRIVGKAATAVVPVAGWVIGGALIILDVYSAWEGSLPQIKEDFKAQGVKETIRNEIASVVRQELDSALPEVSQSVTINIYTRWKDFLGEFELVLRLAEENDRFREILDGITADQVDKLSHLVAVGTEALGGDWLIRIVEDGKFERILALPKPSFEILRERSDPELVLKWADFSGDSIISVVETELYKIASPSDLVDRERLKQVLALEDPSAIRKLMEFAGANRSTLLGLRTAQTKWLLTEFSDDDLVWTSSFLGNLDGPAAEALVDFATRDNELISVLRGSEDLQSKLPGVLALADSNATIQTILDGTTAQQVPKLADLVAIAREALEPRILTAMIDEGQFEAILALPRVTFEILHESKDASVVIAWATLAGQALSQVVETRLFMVAAPSSFDSNASLSRVLAIEEHESIRKLMQLDRAGRGVLVELPTVQAKAVLDAFSQKDLSWLARYLQNTQEKDRGLITAYLLQKPGVLPKLQSSLEFQSNLPLVLTLAESDPVFLGILTDTEVDDVEKLSKIVAVATASMSPEQLAVSIETGYLKKLLSLPEVTLEILKEMKDPAIVLAWADLAGDEIERVVQTELYRVASTADFSGRDALKKVLALEDPAVVRRLMQMHRIERVVLLGLATVRVRSAISSLSAEDLSWLALYLTEMAAGIKDPVVEFILKDQGLIPLLKSNEGLRNKLPRVLVLAVDIPKFEEILNRLRMDEVEKLAQLVSAADATMGPEQIARMIETGQFEAILELSQVTFEILRVTGSPKLVLDWAELAGEALARVVETGLYLVSSPSDFHGREELDKVLAIEDPVAVQSLMNLDQEERKQFLELPPEEARTALLSDLSKDELSWLAEYLPELPGAEQQLLVYHVVRAPILITLLENSEELKVSFRRASSLALVSRRFRQVFINSPVGHMGKLTKLVAVAKESLDPVELEKLFETEDFERMFALPQSSFEILEWSKNSETIFAWAEIAEEAIVLVVKRGLYRLAGPNHFKNRIELDRALNINDTVVLEWIFQLNPDDRSFLLTNLESKHIVWLAGFRSGFSDSETMQIARHIDQNQSLVYELAIDDVKRHLLESSILELDLAFVSSLAGKPRSYLPSMSMLMVAARAIAGDLSWPLYQYYYLVASIVLLSGLVVVLILIASSWWFLRRRHPE